MYDWPEVRGATDRLWRAIHGHLAGLGIEAMADLDRTIDAGQGWIRHDLLLSQTCGLPLIDTLGDRVAVVGQFDYRHDGCEPGQYRSVVIARRGTADDIADLRGTTVAVNSTDSQSGYAALLDLTAPVRGGRERFFGRILETGGHRESVLAVAGGTARAAAIDAQSWRLASRHEPDAAAKLDAVALTRPMPSTPLVTAASNERLVPMLRAALVAGLAEIDADTRDSLVLYGFVRAEAADYAVLEHTRAAAGVGSLA